MTAAAFERIGAGCFVIGSTLLAGYAVLFSVVLPVRGDDLNYAGLVLSPGWAGLALAAFVGVILLLFGLDIVYSRIRATTGLVGTAGFCLTKVALILQACVLTWELFLDPIVAAHAESSFLLRDRVFVTDPAITIFRWASIIAVLVGVPLFGFAVYRSRLFPKMALLLIAVGALVYAVGPLLSMLVGICGVITLSVGCLMLAVRLWRRPDVSLEDVH